MTDTERGVVPSSRADPICCVSLNLAIAHGKINDRQYITWIMLFWVGRKYHSAVDLGGGCLDYSQPLAQASGVRSRLKVVNTDLHASATPNDNG